MPTFEQLWSLLYDHGATNYYKHDCCEIWNSLTPSQQKQLYDTISTRLRQGKFVHYNPLQAIHSNILRQQPVPDPTNYNGARSFPNEPLVRAIYNGIGGIYTRREAESFNMQIKGDFVL